MSTILSGVSYAPQTTTMTSPSMHFAPSQPHLPPVPHSHTVPRYHKLSFPSYDGKVDPLGWLNKCERFFRAQHTPNADRVWLASYHLNDTTQQWYVVLERDTGEPDWDEFKRLCQQRFGPPLSTNHLSDLARLPFQSIVEGYLEAFQARLAHAGHLEPLPVAELEKIFRWDASHTQLFNDNARTHINS
jgi:hypothetical protein